MKKISFYTIFMYGIFFYSAHAEYTNPLGLENCDNTCFINSLLQTLYRASPFAIFIKDKINLFTLDLNKSLATVFLNMDNQPLVRCNILKKFNSNLYSAMQAAACSQQDTSEAFLKLVDNIEQELNPADKNTLEKLFNIVEKDIIQYNAKEISSTAPVGSTLLSLPINTNAKNLNDCLDSYFSLEDIEYTYKEKKITAQKLTGIYDLPQYCFINLVRMGTSGFGKSFKQFKISRLIEIPLRLKFASKFFIDLNRIDSQEYNLIAFCVQRGGIGGGHYVAYVKKNKQNWYLCNDRSVQEIKTTNPNFINEKDSGYLYLYEIIPSKKSKPKPTPAQIPELENLYTKFINQLTDILKTI